jgi:hypothetical protein
VTKTKESSKVQGKTTLKTSSKKTSNLAGKTNPSKKQRESIDEILYVPFDKDYPNIWKKMFNGPRGTSCQTQVAARNMDKNLGDTKLNTQRQQAGKGNFEWVKQWGYGPSAYLFDYLDSVLRKDAVTEFKKVYSEMRKLVAEADDYEDPFDLDRTIRAGDEKKIVTDADRKRVNKNYDPEIFKRSVNAVQLHEGMKKFNWHLETSTTQDYAAYFVKKYDLNGDGRINPRELILGSIDNNKHLFDTRTCQVCHLDFINKIDAIFSYIDCNNDRFSA